MEGIENRKAYFMAVVAYWDGDEVHTFTGRVDGEISERIRGSGGFGYDPIFLFGERTFAEMSIEEKNRVSHRRKAFEKFFEWVRYNY